MKHTQKEISEIWNNVKNGEYVDISAEHIPEIHSDDEEEQCISIPNQDGTCRELYFRKNEDDEWKSVPFVGRRNDYK